MFRKTIIKRSTSFLSITLILTILISSFGNVAAVAADTAVTTFSQLTQALDAAKESETPQTIKIGNDITAASNINIDADIILTADSPVTIDLGSNAVNINKTLTVLKNVTILQPSTGSGHPVYVRNNATLNVVGGKIQSDVTTGAIYVINSAGVNNKVNILNHGAVVASVSGSKGRALYSAANDTVITIEDSTVTSQGHALYRGTFILRGTTVYTGTTGGAPAIYDFRPLSVAASPDASSYRNGDLITLSQIGTATDNVADSKIYYTIDGTDPGDSSTAEEYTQPFRIPLGTVVKATLKKDGYAGKTQSFDYSVDNDTVPGNIGSVETLNGKNVILNTPVQDLNLPSSIQVQLEDGRYKYVAVTWQTNSYAPSKLGSYTITGTFSLPGYITNTEGKTASVTINVIIADISDFNTAFDKFLKQGKTSVEPDAVIATLSASGGDGSTYRYSLVDGENDNDKFSVSGDQLKVGNAALTAGDYKVEIKVVSDTKSATKAFTFTVDNPDHPFLIRNPYEGINWDTVYQVKAALHNHTINTNAPIGEWNDGVSGTVASRIPVYESQGYGAVAITDHDYVSYPWEKFGLTNSPLIQIAGNELSKNAHMLSYFNTYFDHKGEGTNVTNGMIGNIKNVGDRGGILYIAHPSRSGGATADADYDMTLLGYPQLRGIEVLNAGQFTNNHSEKLWDTLLSKTMPKRDIWGTASDDTHSDSLSTVGSGWTYLLLPEKSEAAAKQALTYGQTYFSSYRVQINEDDNKPNPGIPAPTIRKIDVNDAAGVITIDAKDANTIEWISENGAVVASGNSIDVNTTPGVSKYVRVRMYGNGGQTMTQPFGILDATLKDSQAPVITVNGKVPADSNVRQQVVFPTASAEDAQDGEIFVDVSVKGPDGELVNTMDNHFVPVKGGTYVIRYLAKDSYGNVSTKTYQLLSVDSDSVAAADVVSKIGRIPETVTLADKLKVTEARTAYDALTDTRKALVTNYGKLTAAEKTIAELQAAASDQAAAKAVISKIDQIPETVTSSDKSKVTEARAAYEALTDVQKALVTNYGKLTAAEKTIAELQAAASDQAAAEAVISKIDRIPETVTLADKLKVTEARTAYDALTDVQKALVTNYGKLTEAEETLDVPDTGDNTHLISYFLILLASAGGMLLLLIKMKQVDHIAPTK